MSGLDRIREMGRRSIEDRAAKARAEAAAVRARDAAELARRIKRADAAVRKLMGDAAPPLEAWIDHNIRSSVTAPLGPVYDHAGPDEGHDGALIWDEWDDGIPKLRYRAPWRDGSCVVQDLEHLARMIAARSIYA